jgi:glycosyltransferase involved in cell wall biosynthesis
MMRTTNPHRLRFVWITDIPTPYRNHTFERMARILPQYGFDFQVWFMYWSSKRRPWNFRPEELQFPWRLFDGIHWSRKPDTLHLNHEMLRALFTEPADIVMVGGYGSPTHALCAFASARGSKVRILGCESHADSTHRMSALARSAKKLLVDRYDAYLVPQERSKHYLELISKRVSEKPFITFPNLINSEVFVDQTAMRRQDRAAIRKRIDVAEDQQLWICPARLEPEKGLQEFLDAMAKAKNVSQVKLLVAGDGSLRPSLDNQIRDHRLNVQLLGNQTQEQMVDLYAAADFFLLPSLRDPSPLSAIEACAASLPVVLSSRVGNVKDVLVDGDNGWVIELENIDGYARAIDSMVQSTAHERIEMGKRSAERYQSHFDTDTCIRRLAEQLQDLVQTTGHANGR